MIESIEFINFKALRHTTLPLAPFTLLLGPNGSGKSSVLQALRLVAAIAPTAVGPGDLVQGLQQSPLPLLSVGSDFQSAIVQIRLHLRWDDRLVVAAFQWNPSGSVCRKLESEDGRPLQANAVTLILKWLAPMRGFALDAAAIAEPTAVSTAPVNGRGHGLAAVLDDLKDNYPERWTALVTEMGKWLPEYDQILFDEPNPGQKSVVLRTITGGHRISAAELSQGTLIALVLLTLTYSPTPPTLIALKEIDRGLHPRLLRHLQDALYRLSYPESCGETRPAIQVIATTHSPYLLGFYRDRPEEVVLAHKAGLEVTMQRLSDIPHFEEIVSDSALGDLWYSGVLGGVAVAP